MSENREVYTFGEAYTYKKDRLSLDRK